MIDLDKILDDAMVKADRVANEVLRQYQEESSAETQQASHTSYSLSTCVATGVAAFVATALCYKACKYYSQTKMTVQYQDIPLQDFTSSHIDGEGALLGDHYSVV